MSFLTLHKEVTQAGRKVYIPGLERVMEKVTAATVALLACLAVYEYHQGKTAQEATVNFAMNIASSRMPFGASLAFDGARSLA